MCHTTYFVNRSLLNKSTNHGYSIHLLIRPFLIGQSGSEEKKANQKI